MKECDFPENLKRALAMFIAEGQYQYAGLGFALGESLRAEVCAQMDKVRLGCGEDVVQSVMGWIRTVQLRALQDLAVCEPMQFNRAWMVTTHEHWTDQAKEWRTALQTREELDIGWVPAVSTPAWGPGVASMRLRILEMVHDLGDTMKREDCQQWHACAKEFSKLPLVKDVTTSAVDSEPSCMRVVTSTVTEVADLEIPNEGMDEPGGDYVHDNVPALTLELGSDTGISHLHGADHVNSIAPPRRPDIDLGQDCASVMDICDDRGAKDPPSGVEKAAIFPEMTDLMVNSEEATPGPGPLLTLSQFQNTAHSGADMNLRGDEFTQCPSFAQWAKDGPDVVPQTPYKGVSIVAGHCSESTGLGDTVSTCRNLSVAFEEQEQLDAATVSLVTLSQSICTGVPRVTNATARSERICDTVQAPSPVECDPWPHLEFARVDNVLSMTLPDAYKHLQIEELLIALPGREGKSDGADKVVFYNDKGKETEVKFSAIRELMRVRTRLGNDIVDFVMSRLYFQCPRRMRPEIQFVLSRVSSCYKTVLEGSTTLEKWASVFLQPAKGVQVHDVRELLLPWVAEDHWSLLVFQFDKVLHFDSYDGECHFPIGRHSEFVQMVSHAWQTLRGVDVYDVPVVFQEVAQQPGKYECGHHTIMNAMLYLKVTSWRTR